MKVCEWPECFVNVEGLVQSGSADEGELTYKDEGNIIRHKHLSSEYAKEIASKSRIGPEAKVAAKNLYEAMCEFLIVPEDPRSAALKPILKSLSRAVAKDASQSIRAIETALSLIGPRKDQITVHDGTLCPTCNEIKGDKIVVEIAEGLVERYAIDLTE